MLFKNIPHNWETTTLGEICFKGGGGIQTGPFGSQLHSSDYVKTGTPIITVEHLLSNRISHKNTPKVSDFDKERLSKFILRKGDIVFSRVGSVDRRSLVRDAETGWLFSGRCLRVRPDKSKIDPTYLSYYLGHSRVKNHLRSIAVGATMPSLNTKLLSGLEVLYPQNIKEQKTISHILGTLDDQIELNKKNIESLENIAKALFKSWFIDFDPVRAKVENRSTGLPNEISDLFPDSLENSELGVIPKGWEIKSLPKIFDFLEGPGIRNWQYTNDETGIRFINIRCINNGDLNVETANRITEEEALSKYKHFALLEDDIVVSTSGTLGKYAIVRKEHLPLNLNTSVIRFRPIQNQSTFSFLYGFIENKLQYELEIRASGSVQRNFGPMHLREIELLLPNINLLKVHEKYVEDLFKKRKLNLGENNLLSTLRDTLLPKLISGELRIPDAEKMIEEVGI